MSDEVSQMAERRQGLRTATRTRIWALIVEEGFRRSRFPCFKNSHCDASEESGSGPTEVS